MTIGPDVSLSASSLTFSAQIVGASSSAQTITLSNPTDAPAPISSITASGDFTETNTCGTTLDAGENCTISVTFKPTAAGKRSGTLTIFDNAAGSPQTVALSGTTSPVVVGPRRPVAPPSRSASPEPGPAVSTPAPQ